jgi:hypothetical protein
MLFLNKRAYIFVANYNLYWLKTLNKLSRDGGRNSLIISQATSKLPEKNPLS